MVTIDLGDVNESPVVGDQSFSVDENSETGTVVGDVAASDPDAGDTLAFSLADGTGAFAVDESGQITVADATQLDAETTASFDLDVTVTDGKGLGAAAVVTVNLTGLNEVPPVVEDQAFDVDENSGNGTVVGTVVASDADVGDALTYAIVGGTGAFAIDEDSGELTVADAGQLDFEASTGFSLDVAVTDGGGLVDDAVITVAVNGVNEAPVVDDQSFSVAETVLMVRRWER